MTKEKLDEIWSLTLNLSDEEIVNLFSYIFGHFQIDAINDRSVKVSDLYELIESKIKK